MTDLALEGVGFVYPDGTRALDSVSSSRSPAASGWRSSARTAAASPRWSGTWTVCCARPKAASCTTASTSPDDASRTWRQWWGSSSRTPTARSSPVGSVARSTSDRGSSVDPGRDGPGRASGAGGGRVGRCDRREPVRPRVLASEALTLASVLAMETPVLVLDEPTTGQDARGVAPDPSGHRYGRRDRADRHRRSATTCASSRRPSSASWSWAQGESCSTARRPTCSPRNRTGRRSRRHTLDPPLAATIGARLGLGSTPTGGARCVERRWLNRSQELTFGSDRGRRTSAICAAHDALQPPGPLHATSIVDPLDRRAVAGCSPASRPSPEPAVTPNGSPGTGPASSDAPSTERHADRPWPRHGGPTAARGSCAPSIRVPRDYADPTAGTLDLSLLSGCRRPTGRSGSAR